MMFSSGKHERLTTERFPWTCDPDYALGHCRNARKTEHHRLNLPRPQFDRPLTNPANPILADFRENAPNCTAEDIEDYLAILTETWITKGYYSTPIGRMTVAHARKVLRRLARLT